MEITNETLVETPVQEELNEIAEDAQVAPRVYISVELMVYIALIAFAFIVRLPDLGTIPLGDGEAHEALAALYAINGSSQLVAHNPLMFAANTLTMTLLGSDTGTARLPTVLVAVALVAMPMLFRRWLGVTRALIIFALLAISPALLIASRTMSGAVWSAALAVLAVYLIGRFVETARWRYAFVATIAIVMLVLMAEPAGFITLLGLIGGFIFAWTTTSNSEENSPRQIAFEVLRAWPWLRALIVTAVVIALTATVFLLYPRGLSNIGELVNEAVRSLFSRPAGSMFAFPLINSLFYEPVLWVFGIVGVYMVLNGDETENGNFVNRALVGWLVVSILAALIYQGGQPAHALWFTLPLAGLSAVAIDKALRPVYDQFWNVPTWGPWLHGLAVVAMLAIIGVNLVIIGRAILLASPEQFPSLSDQDRLRLLFDIPAILLVVITFFLVGSMWGNRAAWRGMGIGVLIFLSIFTFSQGWRAAVVNADDPRELWRVNPAARNLNLLEQTLTTASRRVDGMPYSTELVVQTNPDVTAEDGALAWVMRKFKTQYVTALAPSTNAPVIILPASVQSPAVAAAYVGQDFPVYYTWNRTTLSWDLLSWYYERATRVPVQSGQRIVVWVRSDIYGVPTDTNPGAPVNPPTQP